MNGRKYDICNVDVHRTSYQKHLRSKKHLENIKQNEMIKPEWLFQETVENKINNIFNPKSLKQLARDNINLDKKQLKKELAKKMLNPYYFTERNLRVGFNITLERHHINHAISKKIIKPNYTEFGIEIRYFNKIMKELSVIHAGLINQYKFRYQTVFSAKFDKQDENDQLLDETDLFIILFVNHNRTESDFDNIAIKTPLQHQNQTQEMKECGWRFDKINSMTEFFL